MASGIDSCVEGLDTCRNKHAALHLKIVAIASILAACVIGVCFPILGKSYRALRAESNLFFVMKSFAAGVILATGFVHMLPDAFDSLTSPCLPEHPWSHFPFAGFISMMAALFTTMIDFWGTAYYERRHAREQLSAVSVVSDGAEVGDQTFAKVQDKNLQAEVGIVSGLKDCNDEEAGKDAPLVTTLDLQQPPLTKTCSVREMSRSRRWSIHPQMDSDNNAEAGQISDTCRVDETGKNLAMVDLHAHASSHTAHTSAHAHHASSNRFTTSNDDHGHFHSHFTNTDESSQLRHRVISQVLELGIVAHSVIIGIALGTSESPCTVRPLIAALTFHQFFEGVALGGCIAQAGFKNRAALAMGFFFSVTTPLGIAIGIAISSVYNENSPNALIVEGVFDSLSAGILVYMSLVDLIATDFMSKRMQSETKLQFFSYTALFAGAGAMSFIAKWS